MINRWVMTLFSENISSFFNGYLTAFKRYDLEHVSSCYHLPCTLHTPDKVVLLANLTQCNQAFSDIFTQLQQAKTCDIVVKKASYSVVTNALWLVCIEWDFTDDQGDTFADFCAIYHLTLIENELKIVNVVSHDLSTAIELTHKFSLTA